MIRALGMIGLGYREGEEVLVFGPSCLTGYSCAFRADVPFSIAVAVSTGHPNFSVDGVQCNFRWLILLLV